MCARAHARGECLFLAFLACLGPSCSCCVLASARGTMLFTLQALRWICLLRMPSFFHASLMHACMAVCPRLEARACRPRMHARMPLPHVMWHKLCGTSCVAQVMWHKLLPRMHASYDSGPEPPSPIRMEGMPTLRTRWHAWQRCHVTGLPHIPAALHQRCWPYGHAWLHQWRIRHKAPPALGHELAGDMARMQAPLPPAVRRPCLVRCDAAIALAHAANQCTWHACL